MNFHSKPHIFHNREKSSSYFLKTFNDSNILKVDTIESQLKELAIIENPKLKAEFSENDKLFKRYLDDKNIDSYGNWIYYPWLNTMVRLLEKNDFIKVRTSRNQYKILPEEQNKLSESTIGIVGLSVGQSVAKTIALERIAGKIVIADFDTIDLSNLNRIQAGLNNLGLPKTIITARKISEIDPYIEVVCYNEGITHQNINDFYAEKLDLIIDECDEINIKILLRQKARKNTLPLLMDTSDRGMLDVERYDLNNSYPLFHGKVSEKTLEKCLAGSLTKPEVVDVVSEIIDKKTMSEELKYSMSEIGKTINTWPQLGSDVTLGGAITAMMSREILLNKTNYSGRVFFDFKEKIANNE